MFGTGLRYGAKILERVYEQRGSSGVSKNISVASLYLLYFFLN